jgi:hypothetical protein
MLVPPGGGPPPHRHDFEEMFTILDGEIELTFRGEAQRSKTRPTPLLCRQHPTRCGRTGLSN